MTIAVTGMVIMNWWTIVHEEAMGTVWMEMNVDSMEGWREENEARDEDVMV